MSDAVIFNSGVWLAPLVKHQAHDQKSVSNPGRSGGRISFSRVIFLCSYSSVRSIPVTPQWPVKDPTYSTRKVVGRLQMNMCTPLTEWSEWADYAFQA